MIEAERIQVCELSCLLLCWSSMVCSHVCHHFRFYPVPHCILFSILRSTRACMGPHELDEVTAFS